MCEKFVYRYIQYIYIINLDTIYIRISEGINNIVINNVQIRNIIAFTVPI